VQVERGKESLARWEVGAVEHLGRSPPVMSMTDRLHSKHN
jgi:hypothetical protein